LGNSFESFSSIFEGSSSSSVAFAEIDSDQDILIGGVTDIHLGTARLYVNNDFGDFIEKINTPFLPVTDVSFEFADVDGDIDQDVIIAGSATFPDANTGPRTELYLNDVLGNFSISNTEQFLPLIAGTVSFADIDGDNDQDVLITGSYYQVDPPIKVSVLYTNDGIGYFTEVTDTPFEHVTLSSVDFSDIDGDNDQDVLITGKTKSGVTDSRISKIYTNGGKGNFNELLDTPFEEVGFSGVAFADIDNEGDSDVLITGWIEKSSTNSSTKLYIHDFIVSTSDEAINTTHIHSRHNFIELIYDKNVATVSRV